MKIFFVLSFFIFSMFQQIDIYNALAEKLKVSEQSKFMTTQVIEIYSNARKDIPQSIWNTIKDKIDHTSFKYEVVSLLQANYSTEEVTLLLDQIDSKGLESVQYKEGFSEKLYEMGKKRGEELALQIRSELQILGY